MDFEFANGQESECRRRLANELSKELQSCSSILAAWEGGSSATATSDQFSDIDLNILHADNEAAVFQIVEGTLRKFSAITHIYNEPKSVWPDLTQKVYFIENAPKHFFVDVAAFPKSKPAILAEFMQFERHGQPAVFFDKGGHLNSQPIDEQALRQRQRKRLTEIVEAFPVYRMTLFKELDRGNPIDAFTFYHSGMLRPLVEVIGMLYRIRRPVLQP
jgi:hypothetical protein